MVEPRKKKSAGKLAKMAMSTLAAMSMHMANPAASPAALAGADPQSVHYELINEISAYDKDPLGFVQFIYPWGTDELENYQIEKWQVETFDYIGKCLRNEIPGRTPDDPILIAIASGHGIGKSAFLSMLEMWALSTMSDARSITTANTDTQLRNKTWPELGKWHRLALNSHWFKFEATSLVAADKKHERTWRADSQAWSKARPEAFAGLHNRGKRILLKFDEASAIDDKIWEVAEGALTDANTQKIWIAFGNPTRATGRFRDCFGKYRHRWWTKQVDSREVSISDKKQIARWIEDHGIESDFIKVRVRGEFPVISAKQFIGTDLVESARGKKLAPASYSFAPKIITCDPAWWGGDEITIGIRQGLQYRMLATYPKNDDDVFIANRLAEFEDEEEADAVIIDQGYGTGIYSVGKALNRQWMLVSFAEKSSSPGYLNKRAEMYGKVKDFLKQGGSIPDEPQLALELSTIETGGGRLDGLIVLEPKEAYKARMGFSPNRGDNLALSFARDIKRKSDSGNIRKGRREFAQSAAGDWNPFEGMER